MVVVVDMGGGLEVQGIFALRLAGTGESLSGSSESRSRLLWRQRRYSAAKQQMKIPAKQLLMRMVSARTSTR